MNKFLFSVLIVSVLGNIVGLVFAYQSLLSRRQVAQLGNAVKESRKSIDLLTDLTERGYDHRMIFLHHSVGNGILYEGKLSDSIRELGIVVKGATYGDSIGEQTDMNNWLPKFRNNMEGILKFKNHPNVYYTDERLNDIVMFKSCYPNSDIGSDGVYPGDPSSQSRTIENYKAVFASLATEMRKYPKTLFVYMTFPPLVPAETSSENAARARSFNSWLKTDFLVKYTQAAPQNFAVFDLFDVLADRNNVLKSEYRRTNPHDAHPNEMANREAARRFMEFFRPLWSSWMTPGEPLSEPISGVSP